MKSRDNIKGSIMIAAIFVISFYSHIIADGLAAEERHKRRGGSPQEAIDACSNRDDGDSCGFETPHGSLAGNCLSLKEGLVCAPEGVPGMSSDNQDRKPPKEAIDACSGKQVKDSCHVETPRGGLSGSCIYIEEKLACVPENGPQKGDKGGGGMRRGRE